MTNELRAAIAAVLALGLQTACAPPEDKVPGRWYTASQVERGKIVFAANCARCHGDNAQGTSDWQKLDANGNYPPPPLNGSAHAWHHPLRVLTRVIEQGGIPVGGVMPGFSGTLDREQIRDAIAYFQSFWPDEIYTRWAKFAEY